METGAGNKAKAEVELACLTRHLLKSLLSGFPKTFPSGNLHTKDSMIYGPCLQGMWYERKVVGEFENAAKMALRQIKATAKPAEQAGSFLSKIPASGRKVSKLMPQRPISSLRN